MANIGFVSTSVLESKDGIEFNQEVRKESEEVKDAERIAREAERKPLWQQLAAKEEEKKAKFEAVRASLFAPPRPLDEEESTFLQGVEAQRLAVKERKEQWEAEELRSFAIARASQTEPKKPKTRPPAEDAGDKSEDDASATAVARPLPVVVVKKGKRKQRDKDEKRPKKKATATASSQEGKGGSNRAGESDDLSVKPIRRDDRKSTDSKEGTAKEMLSIFAAGKRIGGAAAPTQTSVPQKGEPSSNAGEDQAAVVQGAASGSNGKGLSSLLGAYASDGDSDSDSDSDRDGKN